MHSEHLHSLSLPLFFSLFALSIQSLTNTSPSSTLTSFGHGNEVRPKNETKHQCTIITLWPYLSFAFKQTSDRHIMQRNSRCSCSFIRAHTHALYTVMSSFLRSISFKSQLPVRQKKRTINEITIDLNPLYFLFFYSIYKMIICPTCVHRLYY